MKLRTAKKIVFCHHSSWYKRLRRLRPSYINEEGRKVFPGFSDIGIVAEAVRVYTKHLRRNKKKKIYIPYEDHYPAWSLHRLLEMYVERYISCNVNFKELTFDWLIDEIEMHIKENDFNKEYLKP